MRISLKNSNWKFLVLMNYLSLLISIILPFLYAFKGLDRNPLGIIFSFSFCFTIAIVCISSLKSLIISFSFTESEILIQEWRFLSVKKSAVKTSDVNKIELPFGIMAKARVNLFLSNSKKVSIDLSNVNMLEGTLRPVTFNQFAPSALKFKFAASVAVMLSNICNIPFFSEYIAYKRVNK